MKQAVQRAIKRWEKRISDNEAEMVGKGRTRDKYGDNSRRIRELLLENDVIKKFIKDLRRIGRHED